MRGVRVHLNDMTVDEGPSPRIFLFCHTKRTATAEASREKGFCPEARERVLDSTTDAIHRTRSFVLEEQRDGHVQARLPRVPAGSAVDEKD